MEYKTIIHDASEKLPEKKVANILSRLAMFFDIWAVLGYSVKHKKFNSYDSQDNDEHSMKGLSVGRTAGGGR